MANLERVINKRILLERIYREESARILATLIRLLGDFDLAEEATQEAFAVASSSGRRKAFLGILAPGWFLPPGTRLSIFCGAALGSRKSMKNCSAWLSRGRTSPTQAVQKMTSRSMTGWMTIC